MAWTPRCLPASERYMYKQPLIKVVLACICRAHGGAAQAHRLRWPSPYGDMLKGLLPGLARPAAFAHAAHAWNRLADMTWLRLV